MNYLGFLCLGLGIFTLVGGLMSFLISIVSKEPPVKFKTRKLAMLLIPIAVLLLTIGITVTSHTLVTDSN